MPLRRRASAFAVLVSAPWLAAQQRDLDPVVVAGAGLPALLGNAPGSIAAFRYDNGWVQIPVQIDERAVVDFAQIRTGNYNFSTLVYTDPQTFTGADPDPGFDADDELVFLARDAGGPAGFGEPAGTVAGTRVGLTVADPLGGADRHVYLYVHDGSLDPTAGRNDVDYAYNLLSGSYLQTYNRSQGPNPEDSTARTAAYEMHFSDRWIDDRLVVTTPGATGVDVLDWHGIQGTPSLCGNTTATFSNGSGAMIANVDGPVRAVRSVVGAESGVITQREWWFYPDRIDISFVIRVHPLCCSFDFFDYSAQAIGMVYHDNLNQAGVSIDGMPDTMATGVLEWQLVTGPQGSLTHVFHTVTDLAVLAETSHYFDEQTPTHTQCTGDGAAYGVSGTQVNNIPNTDPRLGPAFRLEQYRTIYVEPPGRTVQDALARRQQVLVPLHVRVVPSYRTFGASCPGTVGTPELDAAGVAEIAHQVTFRIEPLVPNQFGALFHGFSESIPPQSLAFLGMPGCFQYVNVFAGQTFGTGAGSVQVVLPIPNDPVFVGFSLFQQFAAVDPGAGPFGLITTNGGELRIGG